MVRNCECPNCDKCDRRDPDQPGKRLCNVELKPEDNAWCDDCRKGSCNTNNAYDKVLKRIGEENNASR